MRSLLRNETEDQVSAEVERVEEKKESSYVELEGAATAVTDQHHYFYLDRPVGKLNNRNRQ